MTEVTGVNALGKNLGNYLLCVALNYEKASLLLPKSREIWMTKEMFKKRVKDLDQNFRVKETKIELLYNNFSAKPTTEGASKIHLLFFASNTTAEVVKSLKANNQKWFVQKLIRVTNADDRKNDRDVVDENGILLCRPIT